MRARCRLIAAAVCCATAAPCLAQSLRPSVILKGGLNVERSEDATEGQSPACGAE